MEDPHREPALLSGCATISGDEILLKWMQNNSRFPYCGDEGTKEYLSMHASINLSLQSIADGELILWQNNGRDLHQQSHCKTEAKEIVDLVALLKTCAKHKDLDKGTRVHDDILKRGLLQTNICVGNILINMYAKCGALTKAQEVFNELQARDVFSWGALIAGYVQHGVCHQALCYFDRMQREGLSPNSIIFTCILKACGSIGAVEKGEDIHAAVIRQGLLENNPILGTALLDMYAKFGKLEKAQRLFDELPIHNVVSWGALIAAYAQYEGHQALECFQQMQSEGFSADKVIFTCILKACGHAGATEKGKAIHVEVIRQGLLEINLVLGNAVVDMYAKCAVLRKAQEEFDKLPFRDIISWGILIAGYTQHGHGYKALSCFQRMQYEGLSPNSIIFTCILKACGTIGAVERGKGLYTEVINQGLLKKDIIADNALIGMYAKCGALGPTQEIFDEILVRDVISWGSLITGYTRHGHGDKALNCFEHMLHEGTSPNLVIFICILEACGSIGAFEMGEKIHAEVDRQGLLESSTVLGTALVDMYTKFGAFCRAQEVFDELPVRNRVSWRMLIAGFAHHGHGHEALTCFEQMQQEGFTSDAVTFLSILKACSSIGAIEKGQKIHIELIKQGLLGNNYLIGTALVDMYAKCGRLTQAQKVFDELPVRNVISWGALISGYAEHRQGHEALDCFELMQFEGVSPNIVIITCILKACSSIGAIAKGKELHAKADKWGLLQNNCDLDIALVDMYAKCGALEKAQEIFNELYAPDICAWNALMAGYAQLGEAETVVDWFNSLIGGSVTPDLVTFTVLLNACSHSGLVDEGQIFFLRMKASYFIKPASEHYTCMVDLLGRAGHFHKAAEVIEKMPHSSIFYDFLLWSSLLGACGKWGDLWLGKLAFEHLVCIDNNDVAAYVCMNNVYVAAKIQQESKALLDMEAALISLMDCTRSG